MPLSVRRSVYDWSIITLLLLPCLIGPVLFGSVRLWSVGPLMIGVYLASVLFFIRFFLKGDLLVFRFPPGLAPAALFWLYGWCVLPFAEVPYAARIELLRVGSWIAAYYMWTEMASFHRRWKILLGLAIFLVTLIAWYAIVQHAHGTRMVLNLERPDVYNMRASGTYFCPNHFAALMEMILPVCLALALMPAAGFPLRLLSGYAMLVMLPVVYLTQSRSGWIGTFVGLAGCLLLIAWRKSRKWFWLGMLLIPLTAAGVGFGLWSVSPMVRERIQGSLLSSPDPAVQARLIMWRDAIPMIRETDFLGRGPGGFPWVYPRYKSHLMQFFHNFLHNEALQLQLEYGAIGSLLIAVLLLVVIGKSLRWLKTVERDRDAFLLAGFLGAVGAGLAHSFFDYNFHIFSNMQVLMLIGGVTSAQLFASSVLPPVKWKAIWSRVVAASGLLLSVLLLLGALQVFVSYGLHFLGERRRDAFDMDGATRLYQIARRIDPGNWRPWLGLAHVLQTRGFWDLDPDEKRRQTEAALEEYKEAYRRNPFDMEVVYGMAKAWNTLGDREKALELMRETVKKERQHLFYTTRLGLQLRKMGRYEEALEVFREAASFGVQNDMVKLNISLLTDEIQKQKQKAAGP